MKFTVHRLVDKYARTFYRVVEESEGDEGHYDSDTGIWQDPDTTTEEVSGVILPARPDLLQRGEAGAYTAHDRVIYTRNTLDLGDRVRETESGPEWEVQEADNYEPYSDYRRYLAKKVGETGDLIRDDTANNS